MEDRRRAVMAQVEEVIPGAVEVLPLTQLIVLARAVCIFIQLYAKEHMQNGGVACEFSLKVQGRQITYARHRIDGTHTVTVPDDCDA